MRNWEPRLEDIKLIKNKMKVDIMLDHSASKALSKFTPYI